MVSWFVGGEWSIGSNEGLGSLRSSPIGDVRRGLCAILGKFLGFHTLWSFDALCGLCRTAGGTVRAFWWFLAFLWFAHGLIGFYLVAYT